MRSTTLSAFAAVGLSVLRGVEAANATFFPTNNLTDNSGNAIQAHGGAILRGQGNDTAWYWFGEDKTNETTVGHFIGVNCYKSADFSSWDYLGPVLTPIAATNISNASIVERPKVLYNEKNAEYVMWFHSDNASYGAAMVGVATSKTIDGQYSWRGSFKPFGNDSRDMTVWKDPDTQIAYLIFATTDNADLEIASLDDDYYNVSEGLYTFPDVYWEAPGAFKIDGVYYLVYSPQDGWTPTNDGYLTATNMSGPWSSSTLLAPDDTYTFLTQNAYDITITGCDATMYFYYGDHWNGNHLAASTYSFYPVIYNGTGLSLHQTGGWTLDIETGTWVDLTYAFVTAASSTTANSTLIPCADCAGGLAANMTSNQTFSFMWSGSAGDKVLGIQYVYAGAKNAFEHVSATVEGTASNGSALLETTIGTTLYEEAPLPVTLASGSEVVLSLLDYNGTELLIKGVKVYDV